MTAGSAATSTTIDRSDFRYVLISGTKAGAITAVLVIVFLAISRFIPPGIVLALLQTIVVLVGAVAASLLPAYWTMARSTQGVAGAAAIGLWGTVVFMAIDIVLFRPFHAYPWTWDAVGGGSTWWYLPIWWMLGTFVAWMGGLLTASSAERGRDVSIRALALPIVAGAVVVALLAAILRLHIVVPVAAGAGFVLVLTGSALVATLRRG